MAEDTRYDDIDRYITEFLTAERHRYRRNLTVLAVMVLGLLVATGWFYLQPADPYGLLDAAPFSDGNETGPDIPDRIDLDGPFVATAGSGLEVSGNTPLSSTLGYELTGPLEITVTAGVYVSPAGERYELADDAPVQLEPHPDEFTAHTVVLVHREGRTDVVTDRVLRPGQDQTEDDLRQEYGNASVTRSPIPGQVRTLIRYDDLVLPPDASTLEGQEIPVFHVYEGG